MPTVQNTTGGGTSNIITDIGGAPSAGDTVELVMGEAAQAYSENLSGLAAVDLAVFHQYHSSMASLGSTEAPIKIDAALLQIEGRGKRYSIAGGDANSHDAVIYNPGADAVALFSDAAATNFRAIAGRTIDVLADYAITNGYIAAGVGTFTMEAGAADPTLLVFAGSGSVVKGLIGRSPATLVVGPQSHVRMTERGEKPTTCRLQGGTFQPSTGTISTLEGFGTVDLRAATENFAPSVFNLTGRTKVLMPPEGLTVKTPDLNPEMLVRVPYAA